MIRITPLASMSWLVALVTALATREALAQSCTVPAQCTQFNAPVCSTLGVCSPCLANYQSGGLPPGCPNASAPYCWSGDAGVLGGGCTQCGPGAGNAGLCDTNHPVCLGDGTCGCASTTQCQSGFTCDPGTKSCIPGPDGGGGDGGGSDAGGSDGAASDGGEANDGSSPGDSAAADGSAVDGAAGGDGSASDGSVGGADGAGADGSGAENDAAAGGDAANGGGEGGSAGNGDYIEGGGCACTSGAGGARKRADGALAFLGLALAFAAARLASVRRGRNPGGRR